MPLIAVVLDAIALAGYIFQDQHQNHVMFVSGMILQAVVVAVLLLMMITYSGKRHEKRDYPHKGYRYFSFRYSIIFLSFLINAVVAFLYALNLVSGGSSVLFQ